MRSVLFSFLMDSKKKRQEYKKAIRTVHINSSSWDYKIKSLYTVIRPLIILLNPTAATVAYFDHFHFVHTFFVKFQIKYLRYFILALHITYKYPSYI